MFRYLEVQQYVHLHSDRDNRDIVPTIRYWNGVTVYHKTRQCFANPNLLNFFNSYHLRVQVKFVTANASGVPQIVLCTEGFAILRFVTSKFPCMTLLEKLPTGSELGVDEHSCWRALFLAFLSFVCS